MDPAPKARLYRASDVVLRRRPAPQVTESPAPDPGRRRSPKADAARIWLIAYLRSCDGRDQSAAIRAAAADAGHSPASLRQARLPGIRIESIRGVRHQTEWVLTPAALEDMPTPAVAVVTDSARARQWLRAYLTDAGGSASSRQVKDAAVEAGYGERAVERARVGLDVRIETLPGTVPRRTRWYLPGVSGVPDEAAPRAMIDAWLTGFLSSTGGRAESALVKEMAVAFGYNIRTLNRARLRLGATVESVPDVFPRRTVWVLSPPRQAETSQS